MTKLFTTTRILRFGDCDVSGTAYFPAYLDMLNGVNEEFWGVLGCAWHDIILKERWGTPTVHLSCDFSKPSTFGDCLTFDLGVAKLGRSSVTLRHRIRCDTEDRWVCTQVLAASDLDKHVAIPWPDTIRHALQGYVSTQEDRGF